jgi:hypothetical protein
MPKNDIVQKTLFLFESLLDTIFLGSPWGRGRVQMSQNWCENVNFSTILITFVYVVPL